MPIIVRISIIIGIATTNSIVLIMTSPVANGKSDFDSLATIGNTAITGPADCTTKVMIAIGYRTIPAPYCKPRMTQNIIIGEITKRPIIPPIESLLRLILFSPAS